MTDAEIIVSVVTMIALFGGPVLGAWYVEHSQKKGQKYNRRLGILSAIVSGRNYSSDPNYIAAINLIRVEFTKDEDVIAKWKTLMDLLYSGTQPESPEFNSYLDKIEEAKTNLIVAIASEIKIDLDKLNIHTANYSPVGLSNDIQDRIAISAGLKKLLGGEVAVRVKLEDYEVQIKPGDDGQVAKVKSD
jgi:Family of unknown function (DUF6680)